MRKLLFITLATLTLILNVCGQHQNVGRVTILHWNDFHAQNFPYRVPESDHHGESHSYFVGGTATLIGYIRKMKSVSDHVIVLNAGDDAQGTPISSLTSGRSQIELMNLIAPDAMTLGNHEFDYGIDNLIANISCASYPVICANIVSTTADSTLAHPYLIRSFGDVTVGIIGAVPPDLELLTMKSNLKGFRVRDIDSSLNRSIAALRRTAHPHLIILLSHMGFDNDTLLAGRRNDIDIIVGGHSHTALFTPFRKNRTVIVQAGSRGQYLGKLDVAVDLSGDSVLSFSGTLIETKTDEIQPDPLARKKVEDYEAIVNVKLGGVIGTLLTPWNRQEGKKVEINVGNFECDVMRSAMNTDISFHNVGGIRKDLDAGPIKIRDIWEMNPFGNTFVTFSIRGDTLRRMMEWQAGIRPREFVQVSGIRYVYDSSKPAGKKLISLEVNNRPSNDTVRYSICTNNYIGGHLWDFFGIDERSVSVSDGWIVDRDAIIEYIKAHHTISSMVEKRILDVAEPQGK